MLTTTSLVKLVSTIIITTTTTYKTKSPSCHCRTSKLSISYHAILGSRVNRISRSLSTHVWSSLFYNEKTCVFWQLSKGFILTVNCTRKSFQPNECGYTLSRLYSNVANFPLLYVNIACCHVKFLRFLSNIPSNSKQRT